jgi:hypothetical protein
MVFPSASGYGNFQESALFPTIFSKKALFNLQKDLVADAITNTQYEGEARQGASVKIVKAPTVYVDTYSRGQKLNRQTVDAESVELLIDQSATLSFAVDVVEQSQSHLDLADLVMVDGRYKLRDAYDQNIFAYMIAQSTDTGAVTIGLGTGQTSPVNHLGFLARRLGVNNYPLEDRFAVISHEYWEMMQAENSKFTTANEMGTSKSTILDNGLAMTMMPHGFKVYLSNNLGAGEHILVGHKSVVATAKTVQESRMMDNPDSFGKVFDLLLVWGRQILRTDGLFSSTVTIGDKA